MSGRNILCDSNILINFLNGEQTHLQLFAENTIFISIINKIELLSIPMNEADIIKIKMFIDSNFQILYIDDNIAEKTAELRRKYKIKTPDAIISATVIENNLEFLTEDKDLIKKINSDINFV